MLEATSHMPVLIRFNAAADNDQQFLKYINLPCGSYLTFDKGYNNYRQFARFTENGIFFITAKRTMPFIHLYQKRYLPQRHRMKY